ncbi:circularly permutated Ras protein 1 [Lampris incognitus]|uniref:circularly permutated Ras protein 1 n=1 Tax=Lampris incognitus TaxID=2546036 RepID=UPI0024B50551|nr:circularly permutated Ras protein 1 [Lampris incognitus]
MEFACSYVVCNWRPDISRETCTSVSLRQSVSEHQFINSAAVNHQAGPSVVPPPLPPRRLKDRKQPRSISFTIPPPLPSAPPPLPPKGERVSSESWLKVNINILSVSVGKLVDIDSASSHLSFESPVNCGRCSAAMSSLSSVHKNAWVCEFCGCLNSLGDPEEALGPDSVYANASGGGYRVPMALDILHLPSKTEDDYQNLENTLVVFCVDVSGSMSITAEVPPSNSRKAPKYVSRLEGIQDALQRALSSLLQSSPHRRVALVTFNDEVVVYGDGTGTPLPLRDWALVDYEYVWQQGVTYSNPHCIAESFHQLSQRVRELAEQGATALGPAVLVSVAMASRYPGSKVILCTDGRANIGLGELEQSLQSPSSSFTTPYFYRQLAGQAAQNEVIISVMSFEGTDCQLAQVGRLADETGGRVNIINIGTVATEIQSALLDNVLATGVTLTLLAPDGVYFPYEEDSNHVLIREIGNVTEGMEVTFQFAVRPERMEGFLQREKIPFQLQLSFKTRDLQRVTRIITKQRRVTTTNRVKPGSLNMSVLAVHCAQLCARLTMENRVDEAQRLLRAQQDLLRDIRGLSVAHEQESIYSNWMESMTTICDNLSAESPALSDEAAKVVYQMKRARSVCNTKSRK